MTTESVVPEVLHPWAIYLRASEEARRRGDRRTGTDHILLALFEDPSVEAVLGVSLQQAREALESLNREALGALGLGPGADAPGAADARRAEEAEDQRRREKRSLPNDAGGKESPRGSVQAQGSSEAPGHRPRGAGADPRSPTTRSCGGAVGRSR